MLSVRFDPENGGIAALTFPDDPAALNWLHGEEHTFGTINGVEVLSVTATPNGMTAVYRTKHLLVRVERCLSGDSLRERYTFENALPADVFIGRGDVGIFTTFHDGYTAAGVCMRRRCHAHIWCGGESSYICARKMGPYPDGLGLVLTEGDLDTYSVLGAKDNTRGDFLLHPAPLCLCPGESFTVAWEIFRFREGTFFDRLQTFPHTVLVEADNYTVFTDEPIEFTVRRPHARVTWEGKAVPTVSTEGGTHVTFRPARTGHHTFDIEADGVRTRAEFFVQIPFPELARRRAEFIVRHQQYRHETSALDGAYLIYDNQDGRMVFDQLNGDRNACRERLVMGLFLARYLQYDRDPEIYDSLMRYYRFVTREFYDEESGEVYNDIGKDPRRKRLYNAPWMSLFTMEMYRLTGDVSYLDKMYKLLCVYYTIGGEHFYPNGLSMYETVTVLREAGRTEMAERLCAMYRRHVDNIVKTGTNYPEHEVKYEQTIVSPAAAFTAQMYMLSPDPVLKEACRLHIQVLERFNGCQPSHYLCESAIRFWDAFWFGKEPVYGDTFPHTASVHTSDAFLHYYWISGNERYKKRAICGARNNLSLFSPDGRAACTRLYPFRSDGARGEYNDAFANEQDGLLYFLIKFFGMMDGKEPPCPIGRPGDERV